MSTYIVTMKRNGKKYRATVNASSADEARKFAEGKIKGNKNLFEGKDTRV